MECGTNMMMIKLVLLERIYRRSKNQLKMLTFFFIKKFTRKLAPKFKDPQKKQIKNTLLE